MLETSCSIRGKCLHISSRRTLQIDSSQRRRNIQDPYRIKQSRYYENLPTCSNMFGDLMLTVLFLFVSWQLSTIAVREAKNTHVKLRYSIKWLCLGRSFSPQHPDRLWDPLSFQPHFQRVLGSFPWDRRPEHEAIHWPSFLPWLRSQMIFLSIPLSAFVACKLRRGLIVHLRYGQK